VSSSLEDSSSNATGFGARLRGIAGVVLGFFGFVPDFLKMLMLLNVLYS
jgi:hypothetical protein